MFKKIFAGILLFIFIVGCSSKKVKEEQGKQSADNAISSEAMSFDPQGSDSQKIDGLRSIHFPFDRSALEKSEKEILAKNAEWIKAHSSVSVQIEGHCDLKGSTEYNLALGERRAKTAQDYLLSLGVKADQLSIISYGKEVQVCTVEDEQCRQQNRRAAFSMHP